MRNQIQSSLKQEFLRRWMNGLRKYGWRKKKMSLLERKKAIKLSADLAMASTRDNTVRWSRALIAGASSSGDENTKALADHVLGSPSPHNNTRKVLTRRNCTNTNYPQLGCTRRRKLMARRRSRTVQKVAGRLLVRKRTRRLKSLLPGGELMDDDVSLIEETLDYIQSLRAQVEVMRGLVTASHLIINPP